MKMQLAHSPVLRSGRANGIQRFFRTEAVVLISRQLAALYSGSLSFRAIRAAGRSMLAVTHELNRGQSLKSILRRT